MVQVAKFLGTRHFSFEFTVQQGLDVLNDVIYHLETFDVTTVRASTPMFLLARRVKVGSVIPKTCNRHYFVSGYRLQDGPEWRGS